MISKLIASLTIVMVFAATGSFAQSREIIRHRLPNSDFPILQAVEIPADAILVYVSGTVPKVASDNAGEGSAEYFGDTATQTASVLASCRRNSTATEGGASATGACATGRSTGKKSAPASGDHKPFFFSSCRHA